MKFILQAISSFVKICLCLTIALLVSCAKDEDPTTEDRNIMQILAANTNFSTFQEMIIRANMGDELASDGPFTLFAPTNGAVNTYLQEHNLTRQQLMESPRLKEFVLYHTMAGVLRSHQIPVGEMETLSSNNNLSFAIDGNSILINGNTNILTADVAAVNGIIHGVNRVLIAPHDDINNNSIIGVLSRMEDFSLFSAAVLAADLRDELSSSDITFFAPTDEAFEIFLEDNNMSWEAFLGNQPLVSSVLLNHTLKKAIPSSELAAGMVENALGRQVFLSIGDSIFINGNAKLITTDLTAENGMIHGVNRLISPASRNISEFIIDHTYLRQFSLAIIKLNMVEELTTGGPFTLFAPTDEAFRELYAALKVEGVNDIEEVTLREIVNYHFVQGYHFTTDFADGETLTSRQGEAVSLNIDQGLVANATLHPTRRNRLATNGLVHVTNGILLPPSMR